MFLTNLLKTLISIFLLLNLVKSQMDENLIKKEDFISFELRVFWAIISATIFFGGGLANLVLLIALKKYRELHTGFYTLCGGIIITDMLIGLVFLPGEIWGTVCMHVLGCDLPVWWCPWNETLLEVALNMSIYGQTLIALNRFCAVIL